MHPYTFTPSIGSKFMNLEEATKKCKEHAESQGFNISIAKSSTNPVAKRRYYCELKCSRAGTYRSKSTGQRRSSHKRCGCKYRIRMKEMGQEWIITHFGSIHNHEHLIQNDQNSEADGHDIREIDLEVSASLHKLQCALQASTDRNVKASVI